MLVFEEPQSPIPFAPAIDSRSSHLFNHLEEIQSLSFAEEVVRSLPEPLRGRLHSADDSTGAQGSSAIAAKISHAITAEPVRKSNLVRIRIRLGDPELCMAVADAAAVADWSAWLGDIFGRPPQVLGREHLPLAAGSTAASVGLLHDALPLAGAACLEVA